MVSAMPTTDGGIIRFSGDNIGLSCTSDEDMLGVS